METYLAPVQSKWMRVCNLLHRIMETLFYSEPVQMSLILGYANPGFRFASPHHLADEDLFLHPSKPIAPAEDSDPDLFSPAPSGSYLRHLQW